jgi:YVTN family beta-propeller protein
MLRITIVSAALLTTFAAHAAPTYTVTKTIPLGAPDKWDYLSFDAASHRVFVAHADHTDVIDAATGAILGKLAGLSGAHGQTVTADGTIWADSGKTGTVTAYDPKTFAAIKTLPVAPDADGVVTGPHRQRVVVVAGDSESATLIDATTKTVQATVKLGGAPESAAIDEAGHIYIDLASTKEIAVVDIATAKVTARYPIPDCTSSHGLAIDSKTRRLFPTCVNTKMLVLDADTGHVLQTLPIGHGTDAAAFDPVRHLVYSSNSDGTLSTFSEDSKGTLTALGDVPTAPGSRTLAVDPSNGRVFLVTADLEGTQPAPVNGRVHYNYKPGSVHLLFLDPK